MKVWIILLLLLATSASFADSALEQLNSETPYKITKNNQVTLLAYPAGYRLDWTTPGALIRKVIWNTITRQEHPLSHLDVFLRCEGEKPILMGMSRVKTWKAYGDVLFRGQSLNLLTAVFPGFLQTPEQVMEYLRPSIQNGSVRAVTFEITSKNCKRLLSYYREYVKRKYYEQYSGFTSNVYAGEGAGCAAYAVSYLHVGGLLDPYLKESWTRRLSVPLRLLPEGENPPGMWSYAFGADESWAQKNEPAKDILVFDPEKIYDWVHEQSIFRFTSPFRSKLTYVEQAIELVVDGRNANPEDDYWLYKWP